MHRILLVFLALIAFSPALAAEPSLSRFLDDIAPEELHPQADRFGEMTADASIIELLHGDEPVGWAFLNSDFATAVGYSGKPIHIMVGLDREGRISGAKLVKHYEPIVLVGIPESAIDAVIDHYRGIDVAEELESGSGHELDIVSGATVTIMVIDDSIIRSAIKVAQTVGLIAGKSQKQGPLKRIDKTIDEDRSWSELVGDGSLRWLSLDIGTINRAFAEHGDARATEFPEPGADSDTFIDLYVGLATIPTIGRNVMGPNEYANMEKRLAKGDNAILLAARGRYSFKGSGYVRGGIFDRIHLIQGDISIRFRDRQHKRLGQVQADGAPAFDEFDLFVIPAESGFDPSRPWRIQLLVNRMTGPTTKAFLTFDLDFVPPAKYLETVEPLPVEAENPPAASEATLGEKGHNPLWKSIWQNRRVDIAILAAALVILTGGFFFQMQIARYPRLVFWGRIAFLTFTLGWLGWWANAQLSVVNVMAFTGSLLSGFSWDYFLMDPLIFMLWFAVAASLIFWGRGAYCGWLCPFGALQELTNRFAKFLRIPQWQLPWGLHERLWPLKYMIFLVLFGVSLYSLDTAEKLAEIEPFKTAIILKFVRDWPFVVFAAGLLVVGLFVERFYCRYLCPLGAALAIPGRLRMFEWLKRYRDCGNPCHVCANECMVQAIHPEGHINPNECLYCLHCQVVYVDDHKCPVCVKARLRRARLDARAAAGSNPVPSSGTRSSEGNPDHGKTQSS
ncbi:MAG: regulatory protein NosR [Geminicoccaceae bacterium]|nr:regulatory protein NosR [Geminicoccaceae bacterium]